MVGECCMGGSVILKLKLEGGGIGFEENKVYS